MHYIHGSFAFTFDRRSANKLTTALVQEFSREIVKALKTNKKQMLNYVKSIVRENLMNSPEVQSIIDDSGKLRVELGIVSGNTDILRVIDEIINRINIDINKSGTPSKDINIEMKIYIEGEYVDLYSKTYSSYVSKGGAKVEWLSWLLEAGNTDVVFGYKIRYGVDIGRTGDAIMMPSKTSNWRVPPEFSGVADNNFVTRSFENVDKELLKFIGDIMK